MARMGPGFQETAVVIVKSMNIIVIISTEVVQMVVRLAGKVLPVAKELFSYLYLM